MALSVKIGSALSRTTTGNQGYTGVGFQPKVLIFIHSGLGEGGACIGAAVSSTERGEAHATLDDAVTTSNTLRGWSASRCIFTVATNAIARWSATLVSMDSDGFTLNWTTVQGTAVTFAYIALGGTDLTNVKVASFNVNNGTGLQSFSGTGFQPDALIFFGTHSGTSAVDGDAHGSLFLGHGFSPSDQGVSAYLSQDNTGAGDEQGGSRTDSCIGGADTDLSWVTHSELADFTSDGFQINRIISGLARTHFYVALKGTNLRFKGGSLTQPTSNGQQSATDFSFTPQVIFFHSGGVPVPGVANIDANISHWFGASRASNERLGLAIGATDAADPTETVASLGTAVAVRAMNGAGTTVTIADFVARNNNGFTINWTTTDATQRKVLYFGLGEVARSLPPRRRIPRELLAA